MCEDSELAILREMANLAREYFDERNRPAVSWDGMPSVQDQKRRRERIVELLEAVHVPSVISSASPLSEDALVDLIYEAKLDRELMNVDVDKPPFYPGEVIRGRIVLDIIRDRIRHLIRESARLSASAPSPEDKGSDNG